MIILKLGGSVITDKSKVHHFHKETMARLAAEIKKADKQCIVIHGAGSFGHIPAKKYQLSKGYENSDQLLGVCETQGSVFALNTLVVSALHQAGVCAVSLPPRAMLQLEHQKLNKFSFDLFEGYLSLGFTPVSFGDVVLDTKQGFAICSGDLLISTLVRHFKPEKVVFVFDEDGLYTANPKHNADATLVNTISVDDFPRVGLQADTHDDVTQGMRGKLQVIKEIASQGIDSFLVNGNIDNRLYHTLMGKETIHTRIIGGPL